MAAWIGDERFDDQDAGLDLFSLAVILITFAVLVAWGVVAAGGPS